MRPVDRLRNIASWRVNGRIDVDEAGYCTRVVGQHRHEVDDDWALPELLVFGRSCKACGGIFPSSIVAPVVYTYSHSRWAVSYVNA
jgi:hypothetical protein